MSQTIGAAALVLTAGLAIAWTQAPPTPLAPHTQSSVVDGAALYKQHCATCHGVDGRGDGPAAPAMRFMPSDLTALAMENHGMFPSERVRQIIEGRGPAAHGNRLMPVWGDIFARTARGRDSARQRIDALVEFLESIQLRPA
ncbi:MAG TPA: cytochrome c [Vicinamibacterales bacterium]|nr:cytochrome c [Vicinamibacterales bacterium]